MDAAPSAEHGRRRLVAVHFQLEDLPMTGRSCEVCSTRVEPLFATEKGLLCLVDARWVMDAQDFGSLASKEPSEPSDGHHRLDERHLSGHDNGSLGMGDGSLVFADGSVEQPPEQDGYDRTALRLRALDVAVADGGLARLGRFRCVIPEHDDDARVYSAGRHWKYHCCGSGRSYGLAELRARIAYGEDRRFSGVELARWGERLDYEAGLLVPRRVPLKIPVGASQALWQVAEGWRLLVGLRGLSEPSMFSNNEPYVFARRFVMAWCGVTDAVARRGVKEMEDHGLVVRVGSLGPCTLFQPAHAARLVEVLGSEDAVVCALQDAFEATDVTTRRAAA